MSNPSEGDQRGVEPQPGPSRCAPSRQGYCGYCRVLYSNLDQHLSSLRHLDSVRTLSRGSTSSTVSSQSRLTLLERFLQDVLQHHPHRYNDPRPSHADLPLVSAPLLPKAELAEVRFCGDDSRSHGTRENLPSSGDSSHPTANQTTGEGTCIQSQEDAAKEACQARLSAPIREQQEERTAPTGHTQVSHSQTPPPAPQTTPPVHRKAHRKTNRRKTSESSSAASPPLWHHWRKERRGVHRDQVFSDHMDPLDRTIEEVIQTCCHGVTSTSCQQEETDSFHFSLPVSMETHNDDWDSPVQVVLQRRSSPVQVIQQDVGRLMDIQVDMDDHGYAFQLDSALHGQHKAGGGAKQEEEGFLALPIQEIMPTPAHIPASFWGKTWAQIEQEDEEKVGKLIRQFRQGPLLCYFDSESLARYGRRSHKKGRGGMEKAEPAAGVMPLLDQDEDDSAHVRRRRRGFRVASRCQVVKVSHSTQTIQLVTPAVRQPEALPPVPPANLLSAERTPEVSWRRLPSSYSSIMTPLQPHTSLVYLLCTGSPAHPYTCSPLSAPKRCRKKRRPLDVQEGLKVKYKRLPVRFYDPSTNRILRNAPRGSAPSVSAPPSCVRQLFRSLSPDLNTSGVRGRGRTRRRGGRCERTRPHAPLSKKKTKAPPLPRREGLRSRRGRGSDKSRR
ncbi:DBF4-type zinc finger-containing protein 2 [Sphaeramia orbicularis]|uniref:DBF4-type zinc finger-containing protein 2 n=1 Tax=Sphaeramia orbicularis TaxID=375764 RepID=UPI001180CF0B|nr:DBF4-type zinc finger-containing protein 2 [Sphaeramia orbicularis]